ncbi:MAG: hypothetical protein DWI12_03850 [Planctomycetota bacterium]|nr:MAG: hypothetical protein DWI12_03850 [Planctomycetota bacterium]
MPRALSLLEGRAHAAREYFSARCLRETRRRYSGTMIHTYRIGAYVRALTVVISITSAVFVEGSRACAVDIVSPAKGDSFAPRIVADGAGVILSWIERDASSIAGQPDGFRFCMSRCEKDVWSPVANVAPGQKLFANWADTPTIVRARDGALLATWLRQAEAGGYIYDAMVSRSTDDGRSWNILGPLHDDGKPAEHGFVSADTARDSTAFCWLDGRAMTAHDSHGAGDDHGGGDMTLRAARVAPTTERPSPPSEILDERTCECCPTDLAIGSNGPIVVYRDRREDGTRDISLVRWLGEGWSQPQAIGSDGWKLEGCPVNGPSISANGNDVVVAWWTGALAQGGLVKGAVRAARSRDGGATFAATVELDSNGSVGRVETLLLPSGDALILWIDARRSDGIVVLRRMHADGSLGELHTVAEVTADRSSGFPRATVQGTDLWLAITAVGGEKSRSVKVIQLPIDSLR